MQRRTKRRARVTWLPTLGSQNLAPEPNILLSGLAGTLTVGAISQPILAITPVTFDTPQENTTGGITVASPLSDIIGNEYFLRRIVGKIFVSRDVNIDGTGELTGPTAILVGAGFFVARADSDPDSDVPIGGTSPTVQRESYNPLDPRCIREPWIWRRTWILGTGTGNLGSGTGAQFFPAGSFPSNNALYGSVLDGPHVDARTRRRVTSDDRLWFVLAAAPPPSTVEPSTATGTVFFYGDFRYLASLRKARNRGNF